MSSRSSRASRKATPVANEGSSSKKAKLGSTKKSGTDTNGREYASVEELWKKEFLGDEEMKEGEKKENTVATSSSSASSSSTTTTSSSSTNKKQSWYQKGADYWMSQDASIDGVLGGFGHISPIDISGSKTFLQTTLKDVKYDRAIDCGAGIGRISKSLLCPLFKTVDLVEQCSKYVEQAKVHCSSCKNMDQYIVKGLQDFIFPPQTYDVIWIQWCIGHLPDIDFIPFMQRCVVGLKEKGYIIVKENNAKPNVGFVMDCEDQSVTRTDAQYRTLFEQSNLELVATELQKNFPSQLFPVRMYALRPKKNGESSTTTAAPASSSSPSSSSSSTAASSTAMDEAK